MGTEMNRHRVKDINTGMETSRRNVKGSTMGTAMIRQMVSDLVTGMEATSFLVCLRADKQQLMKAKKVTSSLCLRADTGRLQNDTAVCILNGPRLLRAVEKQLLMATTISTGVHPALLM